MADMRIGGLASGMDIDKLVGDLMKAERMPLDKLEQDKIWLTWQRDAYRDVNSMLLELKNMAFDMQLSKSLNSKTTTSTNPSAITATAASSASDGSYTIDVDQLATAAIKVSQMTLSSDGEGLDLNKTLKQLQADGDLAQPLKVGSNKIVTYGENGDPTEFTINITEDMTLNEIFDQVNESDLGVRVFYDKNADKVVMERTSTGDFNTDSSLFMGSELGFDGGTASFFTDTLGLWNGKSDANGNWVKAENGGTDAQFTYNNTLTINSHENNYTLNGVTYNFNSVTDDAVNNGNVRVSVNNDVDKAVENITKFVEKYNEIVEKLNTEVNERRNYDYKPLTEKQKEAMEEKEIELWEEQAKKGLLSGDSVVQGALYDMRRNWFSEVENAGAYDLLSDIGIKTSANYLDGGKLEIDEDKLRQAITDNPEAVQKLFSNTGTDSEKGIAVRLEETLERTMTMIEEKAGKPSSTLQQYTLGKRLDNLNESINALEDRLVQIENRYWSQFSAMEQAISRMNQQSMFLMQQFGGGA